MTSPTHAPDPLYVRLADRHPELDGVQWRVNRNSGTTPSREYIRGDKIDTGDSRVLAFRLDDGTEVRYELGEWNSVVGMPKKCDGTDLKAIIYREYLFGLADLLDLVNTGSWLQRQPEYREAEAAQSAARPPLSDEQARARVQRRPALHALDTMDTFL